jgi:hypothetical protein
MQAKRNGEMEPFEILEIGIPRGKPRQLANMLRISDSLVQKWMRPPASDEDPTATGTPNPIERVDRIFDFFLIYSLDAAQLLASRYQTKLDEFYARLVREPLTAEAFAAKLAECVRQNAEALAMLIENAPANVVRREWEEAKGHIEEIVRRKEAGEQPR